MIISDILLRQAAQRPDKAALVWDDQPMTFGEVKSRVLRLANALGGLGIAKGARADDMTLQVLPMFAAGGNIMLLAQLMAGACHE